MTEPILQQKKNSFKTSFRRGQDVGEPVVQQSPSQYPSSLESSEFVSKQKRSRIEQLSQKQQEILSNYLASAERKGLKQLLMERQKLLGELHSINTHLNEMISSLYGNLETIPDEQMPKKNQMNQSLPLKNQAPQYNNQQNINNAKKSKNFQKLTEQQLILLELKNQKLIDSLKNEVIDFQFMLTGQYIDQLEDETLKSQNLKKQLQFEVAMIDKQLKKHTKSFDKQSITKLEKISYDNQLQLTLLSKKLEARLLKLNSLQIQIKQKLNKIQTISNQQVDLERLLQMYEDEQYEGKQTGRRRIGSYQKLQTKKQKLQKIIHSYNNNHLKLYNKKLCDFRNIDQNIQSLKQTIKQMDYNIVLALRERRSIESQNKIVLNKHKNVSSLVNPQKKPSLNLAETSAQQSIQPKAHERASEEYSVSKRNRLTFIRPAENKHTEEIRSIQNLTPSKSRHQTNDIRRRIYTELQSSHYFSSMQKKISTRSIETLEESENNYISKVKTEQKINQRNFIHKDQIFIPTSDKSLVSIEPSFNTKQGKLHQKKFNLSNTPLKNYQKNDDYQKSFSFYEANEKNSGKDRSQSENSQKSKDEMKTKSIYRKGVSYEIEKGSQDEIQKRLIHLENLFKKDHTQLLPQSSIGEKEELQEKKLYDIEKNKFQRSKNTFESSSGKEPLRGPHGKYSSNLKQSKIRIRQINSHQNNDYYKELCKKLGKQKLLIQEDEDIRDLIYQGMARKS